MNIDEYMKAIDAKLASQGFSEDEIKLHDYMLAMDESLAKSQTPMGMLADVASSGASGFNSGLVGAYDTFIQNPAIGLETLGRKAINSIIGEGTVDANPALKPIKQLSDKAGLTDYDPRTRIGQYAHAVGEGVGGAVPFAGAGMVGNAVRGVVGGVGENVAVGAGAGIGGQLDRDNGGSGIIGSLAGGLTGGIGAATASKISNMSHPKMQTDAYRALQDAGVTPRLPGEATDSALARRLQSVVGGVGFSDIPKAAEMQRSQLAGTVENIASTLNPASKTIDDAGNALQEGAKSYLNDFRNAAKTNYENLANLLPGDAPADISNTIRFFTSGSEYFPDSPNLAGALENGFIQRIGTALRKDVEKNGELNYQTLSSLRSKVGEKLADRTPNPDIDRRQLSSLYSALTDDIKATAASHSPEALQAFEKASTAYKSGMDNVDGILKPLLNEDKTAVQAQSYAMNESGKGIDKLAELKATMPTEQWNAFVASETRRLGLAKPGMQNAEGDVFSPGTFLTNFVKLKRSGAADVMFSGEIRDGLERVAKASGLIKDSQKYLNHSNTANNSFWHNLIVGGAGFGAGAGAAAQITGALLGGKAGSWLMTRPNVVKFLATSADDGAISGIGILGGLTRLVTQEAGYADPETRSEINGKLNNAMRYLAQPTHNFIDKLSQYAAMKTNAVSMPKNNQAIVQFIGQTDPQFANELAAQINNPSVFKGLLYKALNDDSRKALVKEALNINTRNE